MDRFDPMEGVFPAQRQCTATSKQSGERCRRLPSPGQNVCVMHGAAAPQAKAAARRRLLEACDSVAGELVRLATTAESESVRVQAAREVLDRAGLSARVLLDATVTHHDGDGILDARIEELLASMAAAENHDAARDHTSAAHDA